MTQHSTSRSVLHRFFHLKDSWKRQSSAKIDCIPRNVSHRQEIHTQLKYSHNDEFSSETLIYHSLSNVLICFRIIAHLTTVYLPPFFFKLRSWGSSYTCVPCRGGWCDGVIWLADFRTPLAFFLFPPLCLQTAIRTSELKLELRVEKNPRRTRDSCFFCAFPDNRPTQLLIGSIDCIFKPPPTRYVCCCIRILKTRQLCL